MKSSAKKVELASVDDLFTTEQERQQAGEERVVRIPLSQLHYFKGYPAMQTEVPFAGQPYRVKDDDPKMLETLDSIRQRGVRTPGLVRPDPDGGYEIISGHRRHRASELAGLEDMQTINLKQYYPFCTEDTYVEVSDEIVEAFLLDKRAEAARERKMYRYKAHYSLDCDDGIEKAAIGWAQPSPEDYIVQKEEQAEHAELLRRLYEAISSLPPTQARRVHARYMLGMKVKDIAVMEGITPSQAGKSIHAALRRLRRYFVRRKWTGGL